MDITSGFAQGASCYRLLVSKTMSDVIRQMSKMGFDTCPVKVAFLFAIRLKRRGNKFAV